jgi:hypothetical protein
MKFLTKIKYQKVLRLAQQMQIPVIHRRKVDGIGPIYPDKSLFVHKFKKFSEFTIIDGSYTKGAYQQDFHLMIPNEHMENLESISKWMVHQVLSQPMATNYQDTGHAGKWM